ncbi:hypothetical protein SCAR479_12948 [Seiridium cardinale]|uniref:F-box domain-containing protein n=1 Tax=Seiridium cardinale TaxID=138064 RepID=A0ABR2X9D0_9PEZI
MADTDEYTGPDRLTVLPNELVLMVASNLDRCGVMRLAAISWRFYNVLNPELYKVDIALHDCRALWWGCATNSVAVLENAIRHGEHVNRRFRKNHRGDEPSTVALTPLVVAIRNVSLEAVKCLLSHGADVNVPDEKPVEEQYWCDTLHNHLWYPINWVFDVLDNKEHPARTHEILVALIGAGANVEQTPKLVSQETGIPGDNDRVDEGSPICQAMKTFVPTKSVQLLLDHGADPSIPHRMQYRNRVPNWSAQKEVSGNAMGMLLQMPDAWMTVEGYDKFWVLWNHAGGNLSVPITFVLTTSFEKTSPHRLNLLEELHILGQLTAEDIMHPVELTDGGRADFLDILVVALGHLDRSRADVLWDREIFDRTCIPQVETMTDTLDFFLGIGVCFDLAKISRAIRKLCTSSYTDLDDIISMLLEKQPSACRSEYENGYTALHLSVGRLDDRTILYDPRRRNQQLLFHGAEINKTDVLGYTALHYACLNLDAFCQPIKVIELLLEHHADVNIGSNATPLLSMARNWLSLNRVYVKVFKMLLEAGADLSRQDIEGHTVVSRLQQQLALFPVNAQDRRVQHMREMLALVSSSS